MKLTDWPSGGSISENNRRPMLIFKSGFKHNISDMIPLISLISFYIRYSNLIMANKLWLIEAEIHMKIANS